MLNFITKKKVVDKKQQGFTLIEVIIVVSLIAYIYSIVASNVMPSSTSVSDSLSRIASDVRAAYDSAVLSGKTHRIVFQPHTGKYWLEYTEAQDVYISQNKDGQFLNKRNIEEKNMEFEEQFEKYVDLAGEVFKDPKTDEEIDVVTPVLQAKETLQGPKWNKVKSLEWSNRQISDALIIKDMQVEHFDRKISIDDLDKEDLIAIYVLPSGYIERAVFYIYYKKNDTEVDLEKKPYTILIKPTIGEATIINGEKEIDINDNPEELDLM